MAITYRSVLEHGIEPSTDLLTRGFADYLVPIVLSAAGLLGMVRQDSVDLGESRVIVDGDEPVGVALIARRGWTSRLAAMAIVPEGRSRGVGEACVRHLQGEAAARGERRMVLEVIEQNDRAARLYERCGFRTVRRLVGYEGTPNTGGASVAPVACDVREVARALMAHGPDDLPWQLSAETLAQVPPPSIGYRTESSFLAISDPTAARVGFRALVTLPDARGQGMATALLRSVVGLYPGREWRASAIWPESTGGPFERLGLTRSRLSQWQMSAELEAAPPPVAPLG
jgi:ribosomal protein S18 acetylase RimI-like enzyme